MERGSEQIPSATKSDKEDPVEKGHQIQGYLQMSETDTGTGTATPFEDQLREQSSTMKRKAEDDLDERNLKRSSSVISDKKTFSSAPVTLTYVAKAPASSSSAAPSQLMATYPNGALRITRTPGRKTAKNCVNLDDVIQKDQLVSACVFSFFIGETELYDFLPLSHSSDAVPIYIGRDVNQDPMKEEACQQAHVLFKEKIPSKDLQAILPNLRNLYTTRYGKNYHAFYAWSSGSSHTKILLLVYPDFLRLVITSCNMMDADTILGDNHWYIHDLPKLASKAKSAPSDFEAELLTHMQALSTPESFLHSIRGLYDYSKVKVHLVTSTPGVCAGVKAEKHGLLRLRRVIQDLDLDLSKKEDGTVKLEICTASVGNLNTKWLNGFKDCALGKENIKLAAENSAVPDIKLFYPTVGDVRSSHQSAQEGASNIGCHTRPWESAPKDIKAIFHHYESKDKGRLFHQKLIMAYNPQDTTVPPYYIYIGSGNLSQSAWGALDHDKKKNEATCDMKLTKLSNFECGVVIPGHLIESLLEEGTESWQAGIVAYVQTGEKYKLPKEKPWNDPRWVKDYDGPSSNYY